ncbi:MAG: helix-turn-helix transcriptional regulator [Draconibacterium sp.]|nr:helix-turn-helix transcriptional regulator [Draconibacterium sp.]
MKQPELGKKITELRKAKGLTQEELVEKCNISVRTIQRIEAGEVTPRSYTVKTILAALEYDLDKLSDEEKETDSISSIRGFFLIDAENCSRPRILSHLNLALIFGVIYFALGFFETVAEYFRVEEDRMFVGIWFYITIKVAVFVSLFFFQRGFILVGGLFKNYLLKITSLLFIFGIAALVTYDIFSVFYDAVERKFVLGGFSLTLGGLGVVYGIALLRLTKPLGTAAQAAGILEIIAGCFFMSIVLFFLGYIVLVPAELIEIILLYKTIEIVKQS